MSAFLSPTREAFPVLTGLDLLGRGKIRDSYALPDGEHLLIVTSDGISIFDYVLNADVPFKGYVLNMMSVHWFKKLEERGFRTHFVAAGSDIDDFLPDDLKGNTDLQARSMVVKIATPFEYEFIFRNVLTGSSVKKYKADQAVCGIPLRTGLQDGDKLEYALFTPTTKAETGHDENVPAQEVIDKYPAAVIMGTEIFAFATSYAREHGILIADTKFEFGTDGDGKLMIIDEVLSPDSSRFWELIVWEAIQEKSKRQSPPPFDKEVVRNWGKGLEINSKDRSPDNKEDCNWVYGQKVPEDLIAQTTALYKYIFWRLTGVSVETFANKTLGVRLPYPRKNILMLVGSANDLTDPITGAIKSARVRYCPSGELGTIDVHVMSVHRNTPECIALAANELDGIDLDQVDYIIAMAGWANQLAGMMDAFLHHNGRKIPVIGIAYGIEGSKEFAASHLSIECLPSHPVILNELTGQAYRNADGLAAVFDRIAGGELPVSKPRKAKPVQLHVDIN